MKTSEKITNFMVYEDGLSFMGIADVQLPELESMTEEIKGAGIAGSFESITLGHYSAMTLSMNWRSIEKDAIRLNEPRYHLLDFRVAQQSSDTNSRNLITTPVKHLVRCIPKKLGMGKLEVASSADVSGEYAVNYFATWIGNEKITEIDPPNFICIINGIDWLSEVRAALGMN